MMTSKKGKSGAPSLVGPPKPLLAEELQAIEENLMKMDPVSLRALVRQATHQVENGSQRYMLAPEETTVRMGRAINILRISLKTWEKRGYDSSKPDIKFAYNILRHGEQFQKNPVYHSSPPYAPFSRSGLEVVERVITKRRTVRRFSDRDVPDSLLDKVIDAATWAPGACCLQAIRFFVVKEAAKRKLIIQPWNVPVIIVIGQDARPYEFIKGCELPYNRYIDLGAAMQNMLLMAYALGLGTCVGTFTGELQTVRRALAVPDYIDIITYIVIGWPQDNPPAMPRMELKEFVHRERWSES